MTAALRASYLCLARRAPYYVYAGLGLVGVVSVIFAAFQAAGFFFWPTHINQATGLFFSPIAQGGFLGLVIVAMMVIGWWEIIPIHLLGLYLAHNRGGWAVVAIGLLATWVRQPLVILAVVLLGAFYITLNPSFNDLVRLNIWHAGIVNLTWFGHGWGSFDHVWIVIDGFGHHPVHAHNDYLELAFEFGLYAVPLFCLLAYALSQAASPDWPILVAFCLMATFAMPLYIPATASIGALALASTLIGVQNGPLEPA